MTIEKKEMINTAEDTLKKGEELFDAGDYSSAVKYFEKSAQEGETNAFLRLADCFLYGKGAKTDKGKAFNLYTQAAQEGNAEAQYILSLWYSDGINQPADLQKALFWCFKALQQGHSEAADYFLQLKGEDV